MDDFKNYLNEQEIEHDYNQIKSDKTCFIIKDERISEVLEVLETGDIEAKWNIRAYNVSQPKLDDIFFRVVKYRRDSQNEESYIDN